MRNSVLETDGRTDRQTQAQVQVLSCASQLKIEYTLYLTISTLQAEQQREMEGLLDSVRQLTRELRREMLLVDSFIPVEYQVTIIIIIIIIINNYPQEVVEQHIQWNEEIGEWQLRCVAYTGNNMRKSSQASQER